MLRAGGFFEKFEDLVEKEPHEMTREELDRRLHYLQRLRRGGGDEEDGVFE